LFVLLDGEFDEDLKQRFSKPENISR